MSVYMCVSVDYIYTTAFIHLLASFLPALRPSLRSRPFPLLGIPVTNVNHPPMMSTGSSDSGPHRPNHTQMSSCEPGETGAS